MENKYLAIDEIRVDNMIKMIDRDPKLYELAMKKKV